MAYSDVYLQSLIKDGQEKSCSSFFFLEAALSPAPSQLFFLQNKFLLIFFFYQTNTFARSELVTPVSLIPQPGLLDTTPLPVQDGCIRKSRTSRRGALVGTLISVLISRIGVQSLGEAGLENEFSQHSRQQIRDAIAMTCSIAYCSSEDRARSIILCTNHYAPLSRCSFSLSLFLGGYSFDTDV